MQYDKLKTKKTWKIIEQALHDLAVNDDIAFHTSSDIVVGYIVTQLEINNYNIKDIQNQQKEIDGWTYQRNFRSEQMIAEIPIEDYGYPALPLRFKKELPEIRFVIDHFGIIWFSTEKDQPLRSPCYDACIRVLTPLGISFSEHVSAGWKEVEKIFLKQKGDTIESN